MKSLSPERIGPSGLAVSLEARLSEIRRSPTGLRLFFELEGNALQGLEKPPRPRAGAASLFLWRYTMHYDHREHLIVERQRHADLLARGRLERRAARVRSASGRDRLTFWLGTQLIVLGERLKEGKDF
jgi:hypothetical protein